MKIETMRKVDYFFGVPLTFLLSTFKFLIPARKPNNSSRPKRVLFIELSEMGSAILADPAMQRAKAKGAEIFFLIFSRNKQSLDLLKSVKEENIFAMRDTSIFAILWDSLRLIIWCQRRRIDLTVDLELFSRATALLSLISRSPVRVGFFNFRGEGLYRGRLLTREVSYNPHIHIAKNFVALVEAGLEESNDYPLLKREIRDDEILIRKADVTEADKRRVRAIVQAEFPDYRDSHKIVLVNANASEFLPQRRWPMGNYVELIRRILNGHPECLVLLTGSNAERPELQEVVDGVNSNRCVNFAGKVSLLELLPLYEISKVLITNDSGPGHFSSVTSVKSLVFFGPETPLLYGSLGNSTPLYANLACSPCVSAYNHRNTPCKDNQCLKVLRPEKIYETIRSAIV